MPIIPQAMEKEYAGSLAAHAVKIFDLWCHYKLEPAESLREILIGELHQVVGSSGAYGYDAISELAKEIELLLGDDLEDPNLDDLHQLIVDFKDQVNLAVASKIPDANLDEVLQLPQVIILIEGDNLLKTSLLNALASRDFEVKPYLNFSDFQSDKKCPKEKIFFIIANESNLIEIDSDRIKALKTESGIPTILYSSKGDFHSRLKAIRFGASMYYNLPIDTNVLLDFIEGERYDQSKLSYRVLVIDDSELLAKFYVKALEKVGIKADYINDPCESLDKIMTFEPDLLVVDLYMPYCSGIELVLILRQYQRFNTLPILFLSSEKDPTVQAEALEVGAEDFLEKNLSPVNLIKTIKAKLNKYHRINQLIEKDSLTGLYLRRILEDDLLDKIQQYHRNKHTFCYALIDIDYFKEINDTYGHSTGDSVLKALAKVMRQSLRGQDTIYRYGGEEIAIIMPNTHLNQAKKIIDRIHRIFNEGEIAIGDFSLSLSFSSGIAEYESHMDKQKLMDFADQALYLAKSSGRNQVRTYLEVPREEGQG